MQGQRIGYVRVSSFEQNPQRQQLEQVPVDRIFTDKASGKDAQRPELESLLAFVREGDTVVVHSMDRLARNLDDLRRLVQKLVKRGEFAERQRFWRNYGRMLLLASARPFSQSPAPGNPRRLSPIANDNGPALKRPPPHLAGSLRAPGGISRHPFVRTPPPLRLDGHRLARHGQDASAVDDGATSRAMRLALLISARRKS